jgi:teichuronic acid biosynthesis protein TuaE
MNYIKSKLKLILGIPLLLLTLFLLLMTSSRANLIAVIMGLTFWFFFLVKTRGKLKIVILSALIFVVLSTGFSSQIQELGTNFSEQIASIGKQVKNFEGSAHVRINLIKNCLILLVDHSLIGVGAGNAEIHIEKFGVYNTAGITNPHNWWVEVLVNYGVFFFIAYLIFYIKMFQTLWQFRKRARSQWRIIPLDIALTGMVIFILASTSSSSIMGFHPQWVFWAFCLGVMNCCRLNDKRNAIDMEVVKGR